jgi:hypothetical protein
VTDELTLARLAALRDRTVNRIRRIRYLAGGQVTTENGPIELTLADGHAVWLDAGPDGEALAVEAGAWPDPFAPPLSPENEEFVARSGKWTAFDVSGDPPYERLVGSRVTAVAPVRTDGKVTGSRIVTTAGSLYIEVAGDELTVLITD